MKALLFVIVFFYLAIGMVRTIGVYETVSLETGIASIALTGLVLFFVFVRNKITSQQIITLTVFLLLFVYSAIFSPNQGVSILLAFYALFSSLMYVSLVYVDTNAKLSRENGINPTFNSDTAKFALISVATIHASVMVLFYLFQPVRTTGLMDDFSQASFILLLTYGLAYPLLKHKPYFPAFSLLIFIAYFTPFSRTANLLLVFLFIALFIQEKTSVDRLRLVLIGLLALGAVAFVYSYPSLLGESAVDRSGLAHFSTLNSRTIYWQAAWEAIQLKPLLGHGLGNYSATGIQQVAPFHIILFVHNDYIQVWHDLGLFWFVAFVGVLSYLLLKHAPLSLKIKPKFALSFSIVDQRKFISWSLLVLIALYMTLNFLLASLEMQTAIAILLADLQRE